VVVRTAPATEKDAKTNAFSTRDILVAHQIVVAKDALEQIESVWGGAKSEKAPKLKAEVKPKAEKPAKAEAKPKAEKAALKATAAKKPVAAKKAAPKKKEDSK